MVLRPEAISQHLKELDEILQELNKYREMDQASLRKDLSQRWVIERGLIAAAAIIIDIADHILAGHFGTYVETYEESLKSLEVNAVISTELYDQIRGLGDFATFLSIATWELIPTKSMRTSKRDCLYSLYLPMRF